MSPPPITALPQTPPPPSAFESFSSVWPWCSRQPSAAAGALFVSAGAAAHAWVAALMVGAVRPAQAAPEARYGCGPAVRAASTGAASVRSRRKRQTPQSSSSALATPTFSPGPNSSSTSRRRLCTPLSPVRRRCWFHFGRGPRSTLSRARRLTLITQVLCQRTPCPCCTHLVTLGDMRQGPGAH